MSLIFPALTLPRLCHHVVRCHSRQRSIIPMRVCLSLPECHGWKTSDFGQRSIFTHNTESYIKLKEKELNVNPGFGVLHATGTIDFVIKPTNVQVRNYNFFFYIRIYSRHFFFFRFAYIFMCSF